MSFSYSALKSHAKVTLPSVESWSINGNDSIMKDPPKSLTIPKRDKVGDMNDIRSTMNTYVDDRLYDGEVLQVYPRGVNPVGGTRIQNIDGGTQATLPIKVADKGAFRFELTAPRNNLPLSRASRKQTQMIINQQAKNSDGRKICVNADNSKAINKAYRATNIKPSAVYSRHKNFNKDYEVKKVIENPFHVNAFASNVPTYTRTNYHDRVNTGVDGNYSSANANISRGGSKRISMVIIL